MSDNLVEVYRTRGELAAQVMKNLLESAGVPCLLKSNAAPSVFPFTVNGMGEYILMVRSEDFTDAKALITEQEKP